MHNPIFLLLLPNVLKTFEMEGKDENEGEGKSSFLMMMTVPDE